MSGLLGNLTHDYCARCDARYSNPYMGPLCPDCRGGRADA